MDIKKLKSLIINKNYLTDTLIFKYDDNLFIIEQYIKEIANIANKELNYIDDINVLNSNNKLIEDNYIYVYKTDKLDSCVNFSNLIIICKKIDKDIVDNIAQYIVDVPNLEKWQIKDYVKVKLPKLDALKLNWLCESSNYNIYRLYNEINKFNLFTSSSHNMLFDELNAEDNYIDLTSFNVFDLTNCIVKKDINKLKFILNDIQNINIEPLTFTNILEKNFINILNIQTNPNVSPSDLRLNYNQYKAIKYNCNIYTNNQLMIILDLLFNIDMKLKSGYIDYDLIIKYIIFNIIGV